MEQKLNPENIYISKDIYMGDLKPNQKAIYLLLTKNIEIRYNIEMISKELSIDRSHIRKYLKEMEHQGILYTIKHKNRIEVLL